MSKLLFFVTSKNIPLSSFDWWVMRNFPNYRFSKVLSSYGVLKMIPFFKVSRKSIVKKELFSSSMVDLKNFFQKLVVSPVRLEEGVKRTERTLTGEKRAT